MSSVLLTYKFSELLTSPPQLIYCSFDITTYKHTLTYTYVHPLHIFIYTYIHIPALLYLPLICIYAHTSPYSQICSSTPTCTQEQELILSLAETSSFFKHTWIIFFAHFLFHHRNFMSSQEVVDFIRERLKDPIKQAKLSLICEEVSFNNF